MDNFGEFLRAQRRLKLWNQREFSKLLNLTVLRIKDLENGIDKPSSKELFFFSAIFRQKPDYWFAVAKHIKTSETPKGLGNLCKYKRLLFGLERADFAFQIGISDDQLRDLEEFGEAPSEIFQKVTDRFSQLEATRPPIDFDAPPKVKTFGQRLRTAREAKGFSLEDVSEKTAIDLEKLKEFEADQRRPTQKEVRRLAKLFDVMASHWLSLTSTTKGPTPVKDLGEDDGTFGYLLQKYRSESNLSNLFFCKTLGVNQKQIHRLERNETPPTIGLCFLLGELFQTQVDIWIKRIPDNKIDTQNLELFQNLQALTPEEFRLVCLFVRQLRHPPHPQNNQTD